MSKSKEDKIKLEPNVATGCVDGSTPMVWFCMVWYGKLRMHQQQLANTRLCEARSSYVAHPARLSCDRRTHPVRSAISPRMPPSPSSSLLCPSSCLRSTCRLRQLSSLFPGVAAKVYITQTFGMRTCKANRAGGSGGGVCVCVCVCACVGGWSAHRYDRSDAAHA